VPDPCRYGSKPACEIAAGAGFERILQAALRSFEQARSYLPNQVFLGAHDPDVLWSEPRPWWNRSPLPDAQPLFGPMVSQTAFYGLLKWADVAGLVSLDSALTAEAETELGTIGAFAAEDLGKLGAGDTHDNVRRRIADEGALPLWRDGDVVGCVARGHDRDPALGADVLLENLAAKATAALATKALLAGTPTADPLSIGYVINTGEEAVGDRYQRGGGNLGKTVAELAGLSASTGADVKAFCCAPVHALVIAGALVQSGVYRRVLVVGGGSVAKLGMKSAGHLRAAMPVLEDMLGAFAVIVGTGHGAGASPRLRLDVVGRQDVGCGSAPLRIAEALVSEPLGRAGRTLLDIDRYAVELHNAEITDTAGSGDVPRTNYRMIGSLAARQKLIQPDEIDRFARERGLPGFSPTQGHVASAMPFLPHALRMMRNDAIRSTMLIAKGSLFLGKMTTMADGISVLIER
jgi:betaine reductase